MSTTIATSTSAVPVVLPVARVVIDDSGYASLTVDHNPVGGTLTRGNLDQTLRSLAAERGPIRVEITEADGSTFTDVLITEPAAEPQTPADESSPPAHAERDPRFEPGEPVAVAVVVTHQRADEFGHCDLRLPPALISRSGALALIGLDSGVFTLVESS